MSNELDTAIRSASRGLVTGATGSATTTLANRASKPVAVDGINAVYKAQRNSLKLFFFGAGSDGHNMTATIFGWYPTASGMYIPVLLASVTATFSSTLVGIAGHDVKDTELGADTLAVTAISPTTAYDVLSSGANTWAMLSLFGFGGEYISVYPAKGTGTNANVAGAWM